MLLNRKSRIISFLITLVFTLQLLGSSTAGAANIRPNIITKIPSFNGTITPATFQRVNYTVGEGVIKVNDKLSTDFQKDIKLYDEIKNVGTRIDALPQYKLVQNAIVKKSTLSSVYSQYKKGTILFDEKNKLAVKVLDNVTLDGSQDKDYVIVGMPQIHEVLDSYTIPSQTVTLNKGNIISFEPNVQDSIDTGASYTVRSAGNTEDSGAGKFQSILSSNPLIKFKFGSDKPLVAYDENGTKFDLYIDGHFGIDKITVNGFYNFSDGYKFTVSTKEELMLNIKSKAEFKKNLTVPLFGIDIPAGIGHVTGAVALVIGADGRLSLTASAHQWLTAEAGIEGGTFWGIPTSFRPICKIDKGFDVDVKFEGKINGYIKAGPVLDIELLGTDLAGASLFVGMGVTCETTQNLTENEFNADIHGLLELNASILGKKKTLVDEKYTLYQLKKRDTGNYIISFKEACLYRNTIWGNISLLNGDPFTKKALITIKRTDGRIEDPIEVDCDDSTGDFHIKLAQKGLQLNASDTIYISRVDGKNITSDPIAPTFPFNEIILDYADFFNDAAVGHVSPTRVMNWDTNKFEDLNYNGDITITIEGTRPASKSNSTGLIVPGKPIAKTVKCDTSGNFRLGYDFKPGNQATAMINSTGVKINSRTVKADAQLYGKYLTDLTKLSEYKEDGRVIEQRKETDVYLIYNLRGTKCVDQSAVLTMDYKAFSQLAYIVDPNLGHAITPPIPLVTAKITQKTIPIMNMAKLPGLPRTPANNAQIILPSGSSKATREYVTEWGWGKGYASDIKSPIIVTNQNPVEFRYESNKARPEGGSDNIYGGNASTRGGVNDIKRSGSFVVAYEGKNIVVIEIIPDVKYTVTGSRKVTGLDPLTRLLIDRIQSRINPDPSFIVKNGILNRVTP